MYKIDRCYKIDRLHNISRETTSCFEELPSQYLYTRDDQQILVFPLVP